MSGGSVKRLLREYKNSQQKPIREFLIYPLEDNMFEWHFTMMGPPDSPYAEGFYHGRIIIPNNYPFAPPDVLLLSPNGRFELDKRICLSISSYHPENWHPTWGITTVLHALREFMLTPGNNAIAAIDYPIEVKKKLAADSPSFYCKDCEQKVSDHKATMLASPPATEADKAKDKDQSLPTPDLNPKQPAEPAQPAPQPAQPSVLAPPPPAESSNSARSEKEDSTPATDGQSATEVKGAAHTSEESESSPRNEGGAKEKEEEPINDEKEPDTPVADVEAEPPQPDPAAPAPQLVHVPRARNRAAEHGVDIRISVTVLDRALLVLAFFISLLLLRKLIVHWELIEMALFRFLPVS